MVAVALSPQVKEIPLAMPAIPSAEQHIANLKAAARNGSGSPTEAAGKQAANGRDGRSPDAYLPPKEVARTIACRFFPNCTYGDKCIFYHPPAAPAAAAEPFSPSSQSSPPPHMNGNGVGFDQQQQFMPQQPFFSGLDAQNVEYMHYLAAMQQQHGYLPPHLQQQQMQLQQAFYGYSAPQQHSQQAFYYPQQHGMYAGVPQAMFQQQTYAPQQVEQPLSPTSPTSPDTAADPAILSASPRTAVAHPSSSLPEEQQKPTSSGNGQAEGQTGSPASPPPNVANGTPYYPVAAVPLPLDAMQAYGQPQVNGHSNGQAEGPVEAEFAKVSLDGEILEKQSSDAKSHQRTDSAQMRTLYQTGNADAPIAAVPAGQATAEGQGLSSPGPVPTNTFAGPRLPIHTGPRMHEALANDNSTYTPGHRRDLSSSSALSTSRHSRPFPPSANGSSRPPQAPSRGAAKPFDPSRPVPPCRFFGDGGCRFGDACFFTHTLRKPLPVPGGAEGQTTLDAKALRSNVGDPDGNEMTEKLRPPGKLLHFNAMAAMNGQRFQRSPVPRQSALPATDRPNGTEQPTKETQTPTPSTEEQLQKLISEMPRQINGAGVAQPIRPSPAVPAGNGPIPASLGHRPSYAPRHQNQAPRAANFNRRAESSQRIPSGENDFPALHNGQTNGSMERSPSAGRSGPTVADVVAAPPKPVADKPAAREEQKAEAHTALEVKQAEPEAKPSAPVAPAAKPAPVSWASRAAQAASLPDPPKQKARPVAAQPAKAKDETAKEVKKDNEAPVSTGDAAETSANGV